MSRVVIWPLVTGTLMTGLLIGWRHFFWQHALIIGIAVAALVYTGIRTFERLRSLYKD